MSKAIVALGQVVTLSNSHPRTNAWIKMTEAEVEALRKADRDAGRWHDDGGEPILYGKYMGIPSFLDAIDVVVTSLRPRWVGYNRRPKNLRAGYSAELKREVLFQAE
jgi:hypothetical protein